MDNWQEVSHVALVNVGGKVDHPLSKSVCIGCTQKPEKVRVVSSRCTQPQGEFKPQTSQFQ